MFFNISQWPEDNDLEHYETSWVLSKDKDRVDVVDSIEDSEEFLIAWESNIIIPNGEIYYVSALRNLKDEDGNEINNDVWIGPIPCYNEESTLSSFTVPTLKINSPFINDLNYDINDGISLSIKKPVGNVTYKFTMLTILDEKNEIIFNEKYDLNMSDNINITKDMLDVSNEATITLLLIHEGSNSVTSKVHSEVLILKERYYKLEGNRYDINPKTDNYLTLRHNDVTPIIINKATIVDSDDSLVVDCIVSDSDIHLPNVLEYNTGYFLEISLEYITEDGISKNTLERYAITTIKDNELINIKKDYSYDYKLEFITTIYNSELTTDIDITIPINSEELVNNTIPIPTGEEELSIVMYESDSNEFHTVNKTSNLSKKDNNIKMITRDIGYRTYIEDNEIYIDWISLQTDINSFSVVKNVNTGLYGNNPLFTHIVEVTGNLAYIVGLDKDDLKNIIIQKIDLKTLVRTTVGNIYLESEATDVQAVMFGDNYFNIIPKGSDLSKTYKFNIQKNYSLEHYTLPDSFCNVDLFVHRLHNGETFLVKFNTNESLLDFIIINPLTDLVIFYESDESINEEFKTIINLRNGEVLLLTYEDDTKNVKIYKFK